LAAGTFKVVVMQFTLRTLLLLVVLVAGAAAVCFAFPTWLANLATLPLPVVLPGVYAVGLMYGPKPTRPFYLGALSIIVVSIFSEAPPYTLAHLSFADGMAVIYRQLGQLREVHSYILVEGFEIERHFFYLHAIFQVISSLVAGLVCQLLYNLLWREANERSPESSQPAS
jgi:hypothetical protein